MFALGVRRKRRHNRLKWGYAFPRDHGASFFEKNDSTLPTQITKKHPTITALRANLTGRFSPLSQDSRFPLMEQVAHPRLPAVHPMFDPLLDRLATILLHREKAIKQHGKKFEAVCPAENQQIEYANTDDLNKHKQSEDKLKDRNLLPSRCLPDEAEVQSGVLSSQQNLITAINSRHINAFCASYFITLSHMPYDDSRTVIFAKKKPHISFELYGPFHIIPIVCPPQRAFCFTVALSLP